MRSYILKLDADKFGEPKHIEFKALDPYHAFQLLQREQVGRPATLWEGEQRLATLRRTHAGGWQIER